MSIKKYFLLVTLFTAALAHCGLANEEIGRYVTLTRAMNDLCFIDDDTHMQFQAIHGDTMTGAFSVNILTDENECNSMIHNYDRSSPLESTAEILNEIGRFQFNEADSVIYVTDTKTGIIYSSKLGENTKALNISPNPLENEYLVVGRYATLIFPTLCLDSSDSWKEGFLVARGDTVTGAFSTYSICPDNDIFAHFEDCPAPFINNGETRDEIGRFQFNETGVSIYVTDTKTGDIYPCKPCKIKGY